MLLFTEVVVQKARFLSVKCTVCSHPKIHLVAGCQNPVHEPTIVVWPNSHL